MFPSCAGNHEEVKGRICQASSTGILELLQGLQRSVDVQRCAPRFCDGLSCMSATRGKPATGGGIGKQATGGKPGLSSGRGGGGVEETCMLYSMDDRDTSLPRYFLVLRSTMLLSNFYGFRLQNYPAIF